MHDIAARNDVVPVSSVAKAKGASLFAVDYASAPTAQLIVVLKKKLLLLAANRDATDFVELKASVFVVLRKVFLYCSRLISRRNRPQLSFYDGRMCVVVWA